MKPVGLNVDIESPVSLAHWLAEHRLTNPGVGLQIHALRGGVSNKAMLVEVPGRAPIVVKQALERLRTKSEWFSSPRRIHVEGAALRCLGSAMSDTHVPRWLAEDAHNHILAMAAIACPHENLKDMILAGNVPTGIGWRLGETLAKLHETSARRAGDFAREFNDRSFFESLRIEPYYSYLALGRPEIADWIGALVEECRSHREAIVHGDFSPKNMLLEGGRLWLLDFEVVHWGDSTFDVGFVLAHFLSKARHLTQLRRVILGEADGLFQSVKRHSPCAGDPGWEGRAVRHLLACLLARVAGRSPLEYLSLSERRVQEGTVRSMIVAGVASMDRALDLWAADMEQDADADYC